MLWIQLSWIICLFGAELCYASQNLDYYDYDAHTGDISHRYHIILSAIIMSRICKRFADGRKAYTAIELREETGIPIRIVNDLLFELIETRMLIEVSTDEKGEASQFVPAESIDNLSVGTMIDRLEAQGKWKLDLPLSEMMNDNWSQALKNRSQYLKSLREIKLDSLV
jgi:membrane protein